MTSTTVQTIAEQVRLNGIPAKALFADGEHTLHVHTKSGRTVKNMVITYVPGLDLYNVAVHRFTSTNVAKMTTREWAGVYCDQLGDLFALA